jgi:hypothetical protein
MDGKGLSVWGVFSRLPGKTLEGSYRLPEAELLLV